MDKEQLQRLVNFFFEVGTSKNIIRSHSQVLRGVNDSVAAHSFRAAMIGFVLAKMEGVDENKVLKMCLFHDLAEIRTGDANSVNSEYRPDRKKEEKRASKGHLKNNGQTGEALAIIEEYEKRESKEAIVAKDADVLEQIFLQSEYFPLGSYDRIRWHDHQERKLKTDIAKEIAELALKTNLLEWLYKFSDSRKEKNHGC